MSSYGIVEVLHKPSGEKRMIKFDRFDSHIHERIQGKDIREVDDRLNPNIPVSKQLDPMSKAIAEAEYKTNEEKAKLSNEVMENSEEKVESMEEKEENEGETEKEEIDIESFDSEEKVSALGWHQLRALAKKLEIPTHGVLRELLQAQVVDKLFKK